MQNSAPFISLDGALTTKSTSLHNWPVADLLKVSARSTKPKGRNRLFSSLLIFLTLTGYDPILFQFLKV